MAIQRTKLLDRSVQHRDAWLCILVTEGEQTEKQYFEGLRERGSINRSRVKVEVVPASSQRHDSAPVHVCARADGFVETYQLNFAHDQLWLVLDVDRWGNKQLAPAHSHARERGYRLAVSHPCFEAWLLLHLGDDISDLQSAKDAEARLRQHLGSYNKANLDLKPYTDDAIRQAIRRARARDMSDSAWPLSPGSRVYQIMEQILPTLA